MAALAAGAAEGVGWKLDRREGTSSPADILLSCIVGNTYLSCRRVADVIRAVIDESSCHWCASPYDWLCAIRMLISKPFITYAAEQK